MNQFTRFTEELEDCGWPVDDEIQSLNSLRLALGLPLPPPDDEDLSWPFRLNISRMNSP